MEGLQSRKLLACDKAKQEHVYIIFAQEWQHESKHCFEKRKIGPTMKFEKRETKTKKPYVYMPLTMRSHFTDIARCLWAHLNQSTLSKLWKPL